MIAPAEWVDRFLAMPRRDQEIAAKAIIQNSHTAMRCRSQAHARYLREFSERLGVPWPPPPGHQWSDDDAGG